MRPQILSRAARQSWDVVRRRLDGEMPSLETLPLGLAAAPGRLALEMPARALDLPRAARMPAARVWGSAGWGRLGEGGAEGGLYTMVGGADIAAGGGLTLGSAATWQWVDVSTASNAGSLGTSGWQATPYAAWSLPGGRLSVDALAGYGRFRSGVERAGDVTGAFVTERIVLAGRAGLHQPVAGSWVLSSDLGYLWALDQAEAFTESDGTRRPGRTTRLGHVRLGGRLAHEGEGLTPWLGAAWSYDHLLSRAGGSGEPHADRDAVDLRAGLAFHPLPGLSASLDVTRTLQRQDEDAIALGAQIWLRF